MITKSQAELLMATYRGILADATATYPVKAQDFARDLCRLQSIIERKELWFFTIFLPSMSKHLTRCLDEGVFLPFVGPHMRTKKGCAYPRLFSGLTEELFDRSGLLRENADSTPLFLLQTLLVCAKKLRMKCDDSTVRSTVASFVQVEEDVRHYSLNWGDDILRHDRRISIVGDDCESSGSETGGLFDKLYACDPDLLPYFGAIQSVSDRIVSSFGSPFWDIQPRHGPGAIADRDVNTSKFNFNSWPAKLEYCFPSSAFGVPNAGHWLQPVLDSDALSRFRDRPVPSRLLAVPKTQKGPRLIAAEPSANMWMQQALLRFLEKSVHKSPLSYCIDFRNQEYSGELALKSSLTKSHATIDLSDASDRMSVWLIERLFRSNFDLLQSFNAVRTDAVSIAPKDALGKEFPKLIKLKKFSTQGSALTFPVQTIVYAMISVGVLLTESRRKVTSGNIRWAARQIRIFGDDIIVPTDATGRVVECLHALGFKVNISKTFAKGNFRESCGVDGYMGMDVTPAYVLEPYDRAKPGSISSLVECSNNFFRKGLWHAADAIMSTIPNDILKGLPVLQCPGDENITTEQEDLLGGSRSRAFGFVSFSGSSIGSNRSRFNRHLHRTEISVFSISAKVEKTRIRGDFALFQWFTERPRPDVVWQSGEARRPSLTMKRRWVPAEMLGVEVPSLLN